MSNAKPNQTADEVLDSALEKHLSDPAEKTEEVAGEQEQARQADESPTEPGVTTEQQPT